ncbi:MAG: transcriptional regulator BetI [Pseudomonadota bacterium]
MGTADLRKDQLVRATIAEIAAHGAENVTVAQIAGRAGVSSALAFHYFGDKDALFLGAMRHILGLYGAEVRAALRDVGSPRARLDAIVDASFAPSNFERSVLAAWLHFYVAARTNETVWRLLRLYHRRLRSNLLTGLRPLTGAAAPQIADGMGALIDGLYIRAGLTPGLRAETARAQLRTYIDLQVTRYSTGSPT